MNWYLEFIHTHPFFWDPIFLTYPDNVPTKEDLLRGNDWKKNIRYPLIEKLQPKVDFLYQEIEWFETKKLNSLETGWLKEEYKKRFSQFKDIIWLIENFDNWDEAKKFAIITDYFWIDLEYCEKVLKNYNQIENFFEAIPTQKIPVEEKIFNATEMKFYFEKSLAFLWLEKYWEVEISDSVMSVVHWDFTEHWGKIFIHPSHKVDTVRLLALIIHEIDGHTRQFTYTGNEEIFSAGMRMSHSEEITEGMAILLEYAFYKYVFWVRRYADTFSHFKKLLALATKKTAIWPYIQNYKGSFIFRSFRWFYDIENYMNPKDLVYKQGVARVIEIFEKFWQNGLDIIYSGCVNKEYVEQNAILTKQKESIIPILEKSSAFHILHTYSLKK